MGCGSASAGSTVIEDGNPEVLFNYVCQCLAATGWEFTTDALSINIQATVGDTVLPFLIQMPPHLDAILALVSIVRKCPPECRKEMLEFFARELNNDRVTGFWSMDMASGDVRFRQSFIVTGLRLTQKFIDESAKYCVGHVARHMPQVLAIMDGKTATAAGVMLPASEVETMTGVIPLCGREVKY
jgi:hypothetical protein